MSIEIITTNDRKSLVGNFMKSKKPYYKPQMMELGDLRSLTLGVSPNGNWDSGGGLKTESRMIPILIPNPTLPTGDDQNKIY